MGTKFCNHPPSWWRSGSGDSRYPPTHNAPVVATITGHFYVYQ